MTHTLSSTGAVAGAISGLTIHEILSVCWLIIWGE